MLEAENTSPFHRASYIGKTVIGAKRRCVSQWSKYFAAVFSHDLGVESADGSSLRWLDRMRYGHDTSPTRPRLTMQFLAFAELQESLLMLQ